MSNKMRVVISIFDVHNSAAVKQPHSCNHNSLVSFLKVVMEQMRREYKTNVITSSNNIIL